MLCNQTEQGVVASQRNVLLQSWLGRSEWSLSTAFDLCESPDTAAQNFESAMAHFWRPETAMGWTFSSRVGKSPSMCSTKGVNSRDPFDEKSNLFAHASASCR